MKSVFVVTCNSWNGEHDAVSVHKAFASADRAKAYCAEQNARRTSGYSSVYEWEEVEVEEQ